MTGTDGERMWNLPVISRYTTPCCLLQGELGDALYSQKYSHPIIVAYRKGDKRTCGTEWDLPATCYMTRNVPHRLDEHVRDFLVLL